MMPILILAVVAFAGMFIGLMMTVVDTNSYNKLSPSERKFRNIMLALGLISSTWLGYGLYVPNEVKSVEIYKIDTLTDINGNQYQVANTGQSICNITSRFGKFYQDGRLLEVTEYKDVVGGIWWLDLIHDKYHIVTKEELEQKDKDKVQQ
jgi:hypothetical protein